MCFLLDASAGQCYVFSLAHSQMQQGKTLDYNLIKSFFRAFLVDPAMNDTIKGKFPLCHNRNPAASHEQTSVLMV